MCPWANRVRRWFVEQGRDYDKFLHKHEEEDVSIQIVSAADPAARKELRERIGALNVAREAAFWDARGNDQSRDESRKQYFEQLKSLYHALTGYQPTGDELKELAASDITDRGGNDQGGADDSQTPLEGKSDGQS